jgi:hypothetical protein
MTNPKDDQDSGKGATETDYHKEDPRVEGNVGMQDQLGHRDQDPLLKDADSDFPEPGEGPEHTGEPQKKTA